VYSLCHDTSGASPITKVIVHSVFLKLLKIRMDLRHLQFLASNGQAATDSVHILLHPRYLPRLLSGRLRKWHWVAPAQRFKTPVCYSTKSSNMPVHNKTNKFECTDKPHFIEHIQSLPNVLFIPSFRFIDGQLSKS
jgi:hypothetical protein